MSELSETLRGRSLLVTGGTGSFGAAVVRRALAADVSEVCVFSRDEKKQDDMRHALPDPRLRFHLGDVRDYDSIREACRGAELVFHAAALKQVPSCEFFPMEAVRTNVAGTENLLNACLAGGVAKAVLLSTDKAVYPINAMGLTKALMEKLTVAKTRRLKAGDTLFSTARYGNVMASRGSVIPLFVRQIKQGKPLTLTDPEMTRFMMSLDDSVDLVLFAYGCARQGDIFVQKSPAATMETLALALCRIFEAKPEIRIVGARHGEKTYEHLVAPEETGRTEDLGRYYRIAADERDLNYGNHSGNGKKAGAVVEPFTSLSADRLDLDAMVEVLMGLDYVREELRYREVRSEGV